MSDTPQEDPYRSFFRPDEAPEALPVAEPIVEEPAPPVFKSPSADTGRLFRSRGAEAAPGALPALSSDEAARLRTMSADAPASLAEPTQSSSAPPAPVAVAPHESAPSAPPLVDPEPSVASKEMPEMVQRRRTDAGVSPLGVYLIVIGTVLVVGFLDSFIGGAGLGWLTGIAVLIASVFCALRVRVSDASVAVIAPPLAYGVAAITVGQLGQSRAGGALISALNNGFFTLADNWFWVIGTTLVALAIVVVRTRR